MRYQQDVAHLSEQLRRVLAQQQGMQAQQQGMQATIDELQGQVAWLTRLRRSSRGGREEVTKRVNAGWRLADQGG